MKVRFRAKALDDINGIYRYRLKEHGPEVASRTEAAIFATTAILGRYPEFGRKTDHQTAIRRWPMTKYGYAIFYLVDEPDEAIDILRVVDGRRVPHLTRVPRL